MTLMSPDPLMAGMAPALLDLPREAGRGRLQIDALANDAAGQLRRASQEAETLDTYQERVFAAIPSALADIMISIAIQGVCKALRL
jgi:hypothetical protein